MDLFKITRILFGPYTRNLARIPSIKGGAPLQLSRIQDAGASCAGSSIGTEKLALGLGASRGKVNPAFSGIARLAPYAYHSGPRFPLMKAKES